MSDDPRFSRRLPTLQLVLSSHSLGLFKECPRKYYYTVRRGLVPRRTRVDLEFGGLLAMAFEKYHALRARGVKHLEAQCKTVRKILRKTWNSGLGRPLVLEDSAKNRLGLVRAFVWATEEVGPDDPLRTHILSDGTPAVELEFKMASGYHSKLTGEPFILRARLDRLVDFNGGVYIEDVKSTRHQMDPRWLESFNPDNQFSLYVLITEVSIQQPLEGIIVSGIQVGATFARGPRRALIPRHRESIEEWYHGLGRWLSWLEDCAQDEQDFTQQGSDPSLAWPQCDSWKTCHSTRCDYLELCGRKPGARQARIEADYVQKAPEISNLIR